MLEKKESNNGLESVIKFFNKEFNKKEVQFYDSKYLKQARIQYILYRLKEWGIYK